ncbi:MAG: extracellular solute-binding protein [Candidatus Promineifilaceae bacterium]|nr:extracellular solute-binding protein [Candidatus Promineifilaceae bacterium]
MKRTHLLVLILSSLAFVLAACQPQVFAPPRLATATSLAESSPDTPKEPLILPAPTPTASSTRRDAIETNSTEPINIWINETSQEHQELLTAMMNEFTQQSGIDVALQLVSPRLLPDLMQTAVLSNTLPDIVLHPIEFTVTWSEEGILDPELASSLIDEIGFDSFDQSALDLASVNGHTAAIPSDGFQQILLYRKDWFDQQGLETPDNYADMITNAEAIFDPENIVSGFVIPTESNLITTHRAFEHLAIANGCQLIDNRGEVRLLDENCQEAIDFYYAIVNQFSPTGVQTDTSARNAFLEGRTGMIMSSPAILNDLVEATPLDQNTGIVTSITGSDPNAEAANFGNLTYLGITTAANPETASAFAKYWFGEGYGQWLAVESERKVPMYLGTRDQPNRYFDEWGELPFIADKSIADIYGEDTVNLLKSSVADTNRWGFDHGQGAVTGKLYESLTISIVLQEMLSGYFDSQQTILEATNRVVELIPNYQFEIVLTPTPAPDS